MKTALTILGGLAGLLVGITAMLYTHFQAGTFPGLFEAVVQFTFVGVLAVLGAMIGCGLGMVLDVLLKKPGDRGPE